MRFIKVLFSIAVLLSQVSCMNKGPKTLADLEYEPQKEKEIDFKELDYEQVRAEYEKLLKLIPEKNMVEQIERRIAEVYMIEGGKRQAKSLPSKSYTNEAIKSFKDILLKYPNAPGNADILYQLARAYEQDGDFKQALKYLERLTRQFPNYVHIAEVHFRMGDIYYNEKMYTNAQRSFYRVTQLNEPKLKLYSYYMLAWAYYKQFQYEPSLDAFAYVLNTLLVKIQNNQELSKFEKPLIEDTIQSMSLALSKVGGASFIEEVDRLRGKSHIWMIYDGLGEFFLKKERFEDSAETFRAYVRKYNYNAKAPELHSKLISTYIKGKFPRKALEEKETFVTYYSPNSDYAKNVGGISKEIQTKLKKYIEELAKHHHSEGQQYQKAQKQRYANDKVKFAEYGEKAVESFRKAAVYYQKFISMYPTDPLIGEVTYLLAETLYLSNDFDKAIPQYEKVAYKLSSNSGKKYRADAGYAAIISYQKHIESLPKDAEITKKWQAAAVESMLRFANTFYNDKRSISVLTNSAEYLFSLNQYQRALTIANELITKNPKLDASLKKTAYGIMAHSNYNLKNYTEAEKHYLLQRKYTQNGSKEYQQITERVAASIYKVAEIQQKADKKQDAIRTLIRIKRVTPTSSIRVAAQYNAATLLMSIKKWKPAIVELKELIRLFPRDKLNRDFHRKLALAYKENKQWRLAAQKYDELYMTDREPEVRRDALFISAGLYKKIKNYEKAIELYRRYARIYKDPFDNRMEARYQLAVIYEKVKDYNRQLFWLRRIVDGDSKGGNQRTDRSRWLAAWANMKYGDYFAKEFRRYRLRLPLDKSLARKNQMLKGATDRYQMSADSGILDFVTMSSFKIAKLYQRFANELRRSPRPRGLTAQDKVLYAEILEEQAKPFDDLAVSLYQGNVERGWNGEFNEWIAKSFDMMRKINPERYAKDEKIVSYGEEIF